VGSSRRLERGSRLGGLVEGRYVSRPPSTATAAGSRQQVAAGLLVALKGAQNPRPARGLEAGDLVQTSQVLTHRRGAEDRERANQSPLRSLRPETGAREKLAQWMSRVRLEAPPHFSQAPHWKASDKARGPHY